MITVVRLLSNERMKKNIFFSKFLLNTRNYIGEDSYFQNILDEFTEGTFMPPGMLIHIFRTSTLNILEYSKVFSMFIAWSNLRRVQSGSISEHNDMDEPLASCQAFTNSLLCQPFTNLRVLVLYCTRIYDETIQPLQKLSLDLLDLDNCFLYTTNFDLNNVSVGYRRLHLTRPEISCDSPILKLPKHLEELAVYISMFSRKISLTIQLSHCDKLEYL